MLVSRRKWQREAVKIPRNGRVGCMIADYISLEVELIGFYMSGTLTIIHRGHYRLSTSANPFGMMALVRTN
tara:strand:- start:21 stop:233 length:213 start_codon:yes stop_codon:yes gene_type:complete